MTEERNALTDLFAACWKDDTLKARFMADNTVHITLPMAPGGHEELSMEELSNVAGGGAGTRSTGGCERACAGE